MKLRLVPDTADAAMNRAARWAARMDRGDLGGGERAEFEEWVGHGSNSEALGRALDALSIFDGYDRECPELASLREEALAYEDKPRRRWTPWAGGAIAASLAATLILFNPASERPVAKPTPAEIAVQPKAIVPETIRYTSRDGERKMVALGDGSKVTLDGKTEIRVALQPGERLVTLVRGHALFDVAHSPNRPFVVEVAGRRVTALGTLFEVRMDKDRLRVTLLRGRVRVDENAATEAAATEGVPTFLSPGEQYVSVAASAPRVRAVDANRATLWRQSLVEFNNEPVADAVAKLNHYSAVPIVIADERVASMRISGVVRTGDADGFSSLVVAVLPVSVRKTDAGVIELHSNPEL